MPDTSSVLLFVKSLERGKVKSRLAARLGEELTLDLYRSFVLDTVEALTSADASLRIYYYPADSGENVANWIGKGFVFAPQRGEDLGERMRNAFADSFSEGLERALLIGSDIPDLNIAVIGDAFSSLENSDAVVGPASDGGYYLIGFRKSSFLPEVFHGINWGSNSVFRETMKLLSVSGYHVRVLDERHDIDTIDDLRAFFLRNRDTRRRESRSLSLCRKIFL